ncbi:hypothetical protein D5085_15905 [Ectothiorhodospiraceae bacterium BW-2]|nr:hypothetical protein D5085_15905 [Ectothiorhodospiraceae bacterium BW-2]
MIGRSFSILWRLLCLIVSANANATDKIVLQLKWQHQFQFAGYYAAEQLGYYHQAGLNVELRPARPDTDPLDEVKAGRAQFGVGSNNLVLAHHQGVPVVVLAVIMQHSPYAIIAAKNSQLRNSHDLAGKKFMLEPMADEILAYLIQQRIPLQSLELLPHSHTPYSLIRGEVAAMSAYITDEPYLLQQEAFDYNLFTPQSAGIDFYGDNLFTLAKEIETQPQRTRRFLEASLRGWRYAMQHPEELADIIIAHYGSTKSRPQLLYEAEKMQQLMHPELIEIGYMLPGRWQHIANTYTSLGMLPRDYTPDPSFLYISRTTNEGKIVTVIALLLGITTLITLITLYMIRRNHYLDRLLQLKSYQANIGESVEHISHQWKQPLHELAVQLMLIEQANDAIKDSQLQQTIAAATIHSHQVIEFMAKTVDTFRALLHHKNQDIPFLAHELIEQTLLLLESSMTLRRIEIHYQALNDKLVLYGNPIEFAHILLSILANTRHVFSQRRTEQPQIEIKLELDQTGHYATITLCDNGGGIAVKPIEKIFKRGYSDHPHEGGSGLGLYVARKLAKEGFNAKLTVYNRHDGACFRLTLPLPDSELITAWEANSINPH